MAMNLDAVLRIAAKVVGLEDLGALQKGLTGAEQAASDAKKSFSAVVNSASWQAAAAAAAGLGVALGASVKAAIEFESSLADVRKVVDGLDTPAGIKALRQEIFELSREIPITQKGFAEMYAAAARAGVPREELGAFAESVAKVAVAFEMTAGEAGEALAKIRTNLGLTQPQLILLTDAMNALTNTIGGSTSALVDFVLRSGSAGKQAGLTAEQTAAFGAAMIAAGAASEVASTSFNNMIKALSRGDSMTDRQISALAKLGYANQAAANSEQQLTEAVKRESALRVDAIEAESRRTISEISRRYRDLETLQNDAFDDEARQWGRAQEDRFDAVTTRLQRQRQAEIDASNKRAEQLKRDNTLEVQAIEDRYDQMFKQLRRQQEDERVAYQRNARDRKQLVSDQLEEQKNLEMEAAKKKFDELKKIEELRKKEAIENAKATAKAMVGELGPNMAKMLQTDAVGTIRDVFSRIKALPAEMQMSVISDLFGDEARALLPLINNSKLLDQALGLVGDKSKYAGSTAAEFAARIQTTEAKMQLAQNRLTEISIILGESFLPAIQKTLEFLAPIAEGFADLATRFPVVTTVVVSLTAALSALVLVSPAIASFISLIGSLKVAIVGLNLGGLIAGWLPVITGAVGGMTSALAGFVGWIGTTLVPGILAFLGPAGWTVLAIAAVVAAAIAFREPLIEFFQWLWEWGEPIRKFWVDAWNGAKDAIVAFFSWLPGAINSGFEALWRLRETIRQFWIDVWENVKATVGGFFSWFAGAIASGFDALWKWGEPIRQFWYDAWERVKGFAKAYFDYLVGVFDWGLKAAWAIVDTLLIQPYIALWENVIRKPAIAAFNWLQSNVFQPIGRAFTTYVVTPIQNAWNTAIQAIRNGAIAAWNGVVTAWRVAGSWFMQNVVTPISDAFRFVVNVVSDTATRAWATFVNVWQQVSGWFQSNVATPVSNAWRTVITGVADAVTKVRTTIDGVWRAISSAFTSYVAKPISDAWNALIKLLPDAMEKAVKFVQNAWTGMINGIKGALRGLLQSIANAINAVGSQVNKLISAFNSLPGDNDIPLVPTLTVPAFAQGGVVGRKTLAMVGDGGEDEYIIPQSKMAAASQRFLSGARGSSVIPSSSSTGRGGTSAPVINITTGPVMEFNGTRYVTVDDFERGVRQVVNGTIGRLRTPAAKIAIGIR